MSMQEHVYEPCARTDGGINILKDGEVLWESPSTDTLYTPHDWENALLVCVTLSGNEKPAERALTPPDDLRKLAEEVTELSRSTHATRFPSGVYKYTDTEICEKILSALQTAYTSGKDSK